MEYLHGTNDTWYGTRYSLAADVARPNASHGRVVPVCVAWIKREQFHEEKMNAYGERNKEKGTDGRW